MRMLHDGIISETRTHLGEPEEEQQQQPAGGEPPPRGGRSR